MKYPEDFINKIICGDAVEMMKQIPNGSVDLVITSPPYNLKNSTGNGMKDGRGGKWEHAALQKGYSHHDDAMPHEEYVKWQKDCLKEMMRIIPENGAIFYNHKWRVQAGLLAGSTGYCRRISYTPNYYLETKRRIELQRGVFFTNLRSNLSYR